MKNPIPESNSCGFTSVLGILLLFVIVNLATATRFPIVWHDEALYTDPAANLLLGNGFTASSWPFQPRDHFWAGGPPLHQMLLWFWMKLFGFGPLAVRSMNYVLMAAAGCLLWLTVARLRLVGSSGARILFLVIILLDYGTSLGYRSGRYDSITILLAAAAALAFAIPAISIRCLALVGIGFFCTLAGLQLPTFAILFCALLVVFFGQRFLREGAALGFGMALGAGVLYLCYSAKGVWPEFVASVRVGRRVTSGSLSHDPSLPFLFLAALLLAIDQACNHRLKLRSPLVFGIVGGIVIFSGMKLLARFPTYYSWMVCIPLAAGVCAALSDEPLTLKKPLVALAAVSVVFASLVGLPLQLANAAFFWRERDYARVEALVERNVQPEDWVYCAPPAYYAAKKRAAVLFLPMYCHLTAEEKTRLTVLIIEPERARQVMESLGGQWIRSPDELLPTSRRFLFFKPGFGDKFVENYNLQVWRKRPLPPHS